MLRLNQSELALIQAHTTLRPESLVLDADQLVELSSQLGDAADGIQAEIDYAVANEERDTARFYQTRQTVLLNLTKRVRALRHFGRI